MNLEQDFDINLLNTGGKGKRGLMLSRLTGWYMLVIALLVFFWMAAWGGYALKEREQQQEIASLQDQISRAVELEAVDEAEILRKTISLKEANIRAIHNNRILYSDLLSRLEAVLPSETSLSEISVTADQMVCKGVTTDYAALAGLMSSANRQKQLADAKCIKAEPAGSAVRFEVQFKIVRE